MSATVTCPRCERQTIPRPRLSTSKSDWRLPKFCMEGHLGSPCGTDLAAAGVIDEPEDNRPSKANRGKPLERELANACRRYFREHRANVVKVAVRWQRVGPDQFVRVPPKDVDFSGLDADARSIRFEAKSTREAAFPLSKIRTTQRTVLGRCLEWGGVAALVVCFEGDLDRPAFWIPWRDVQAFEALREGAALTRAWVEEHGVRIERRRRGLLWLEAALVAQQRVRRSA